jgi:hypothetical protein
VQEAPVHLGEPALHVVPQALDLLVEPAETFGDQLDLRHQAFRYDIEVPAGVAGQGLGVLVSSGLGGLHFLPEVAGDSVDALASPRLDGADLGAEVGGDCVDALAKVPASFCVAGADFLA